MTPYTTINVQQRDKQFHDTHYVRLTITIFVLKLPNLKLIWELTKSATRTRATIYLNGSFLAVSIFEMTVLANPKSSKVHYLSHNFVLGITRPWNCSSANPFRFSSTLTVGLGALGKTHTHNSTAAAV